MKREIPLFLVFLTGILLVIQFFIPHGISQTAFTYANDFVIVIGILALPVGILSLIYNTLRKVRSDRRERLYSLAMLLGFFTMVFTGIRREWTNDPALLYRRLFDNVLTPAQSTLFAMLAFYIASAAYRAFRVRTYLAAVLLVTAFIIMLRMIPLGPVSALNNELVRWILGVPNLAAKRAIIIGVGLGAIAYSMKIILGIERSYMGRN